LDIIEGQAYWIKYRTWPYKEKKKKKKEKEKTFGLTGARTIAIYASRWR
jgi:hypothetical protein